MAYLYSKGNRLFGDIEYEDDTNTQVDFDDDYIGLVAGGSTILAVSGTAVGIGTDAPDYTLDVAGDIGIDEKLIHNGDADTYIGFSGQNTINLVANGHSFLKYDGAIRINNANRDRDTEIMADDGTVALLVDAGTNTVTFNEEYTFPADDGDAGQTLTTDGSGAITWEDIPGASDAFRRTVSKPSATFSADPASYSVFAVDCNAGDVTATLPAPSGDNEGLQVTFIKNAGGNTLTITAGNLNIWDQGTATTNYQITSHGRNVTLVCISYAWIVIAEA
jgi:hypothetical protein